MLLYNRPDVVSSDPPLPVCCLLPDTVMPIMLSCSRQRLICLSGICRRISSHWFGTDNLEVMYGFVAFRGSPVYNMLALRCAAALVALVMAAAARIHPRLDLLMRR